MTTETAGSPFKFEYVIRRLLDPAMVQGEPWRAVRTEWLAAHGVSGENCAATWARYGDWLKEAAEQRGIDPAYRGKFYAEAIAAGQRV